MPSEAQQNAVHLRHQLFEGVLLRAERAGEIAIEPVRGAAGVTELMECRAVPIDRLEICLRRRDLHIVVRGHVEGPAAADAEIDAARLDQRLNLGLDRPRFRRRCGDYEILRQTFALRKVEDSEALEERDRLRFLAGFSRPFLLVVGNEAVGIDNGGAVLALADIAAEAEGLAKRQPELDPNRRTTRG